MFLTKANFDVLPYNIPAGELNLNTFQTFVNANEEEILRKLLGHKLYDQFIEGLEDDYPETNFPEMVALRDGGYYDYEGVQQQWKGMVEMLKPYINSRWIYENIETYTKSGMTSAKVENSNVIDARGKISRDDAMFLSLCGWKCSMRNSLYGFLKVNIADYPDWVWTNPDSLNRWDL